MSQPVPADVTPSELWLSITEAPRPHDLVDFPRRALDGRAVAQIAMVVLTSQETQTATLATEKWVRKAMKDASSLPGRDERSEGYPTLFENRASVEILFRCCKRADDISRPFFPAPDAIASKLSPDETAVLMKEYSMVRMRKGPIVAHMTDDEFNAWVEMLSKGGSLYPLAVLSSGLTAELLQRMAVELTSLRMASSSPGTQSESTS